MDNRYITMPKNILPGISFGSNVNLDINVVKYLFPAIAIVLVGCATRPAATFDRGDMVGWQNDCGRARQQVEYLQNRVNAYREYFKDHPITIEDQRYMGKLKNNLWSLRSSCSALQQ
jgi:hypothetical protein